MNKKISLFKPTIFSACLTLAMSSASHAEIYKWVDANGHTHYSENKDEAGKAKAEELKIKSVPVSAGSATTPRWQEQEQEFRKRLAQKPNAPVFRPPSSPQTSSPQANSPPNENQPETDASRCAYATALNNGRLIRFNKYNSLIKTDPDARMIAQRDISTFCH